MPKLSATACVNQCIEKKKKKKGTCFQFRIITLNMIRGFSTDTRQNKRFIQSLMNTNIIRIWGGTTNYLMKTVLYRTFPTLGKWLIMVHFHVCTKDSYILILNLRRKAKEINHFKHTFPHLEYGILEKDIKDFDNMVTLFISQLQLY